VALFAERHAARFAPAQQLLLSLELRFIREPQQDFPSFAAEAFASLLLQQFIAALAFQPS
jgi:hypothetical protein